MSKAGQYNYKGINAQAWAAMSLFLQYLKDPKFLSIQLEANNFEDFNLIFDSDKKIICESKDRKVAFGYPHLKELLENIIKKRVISDNDEILVVCSKASDELISDVRNVKYFEQLQKKFIKKGYSDKQIALLPGVQFWVVSPSFNAEAIYSLFSELINFWLPPGDIKKFTDSILIESIYKGSAIGAIYSRANMLSQIEEFKKKIQKSSDYFNEKVNKEKQFLKLEKDINNSKGINWGTSSISAFSIRWDLMSFAMDRLKTRNDLDLKKWDDLWQLNCVYYFTFGIFDIFENNLHTEQNKKYVLDYIKKYTNTIRGFYRSDFFDVDVVKIITRIIKDVDGKKYLNKAFSIVSDLITFNEKEFFYLKDIRYDHDQWEKEKICKLLHEIYNLADKKLKQKIFNLLVNGFNITEDDGELSHHSPKEVFAIISDWLNEDFIGRFEKLVRVLSDQYDRFYEKFGKKLEFKGWEHMGGSISFSGSYHASDRHFIGILTPAINKYYSEDKDKGWQFIKNRCIRKTADVSKYEPDFLNRAVYEIILERYASEDINISNEAFGILKEFIMARKGIPHKSDLIYQSIARSALSNDKKWKLVKLTTKKYGLPVNPFAEQIVAYLANNGHIEAKEELKRWFRDSRYYKRMMFGENAVSTIKTLIDTNFDLALELFKSLLKSDYLRSGDIDNLSPFTIAELLNNIINKNYKEGLDILRTLGTEKNLSKDLQSIYCFSLFNSHGNDDSDDVEILLKIYKDVIDPLLSNLDDNIDEIYKRIPNDGARAAIVQFANRLATKKEIKKVIRIINVFINDPDPYLPKQDPNDPNDKYNEHKRILEGNVPVTINSVRGWCGWVLMRCAVLDGREQIPEIIKLSKKLAEDENYYVVHMSCFALSQLAKVRLTVLPSNKDTLFFNDDKVKALMLAKDVEDIAFSLLNKLISWPAPVQKAMAKSILSVFNSIRALSEKESYDLISKLAKLTKEAIEESAPLFIYYAEFRKNACKDWKFSVPGFYDDLAPDKYDSKKFEEILNETIKKLQNEDPNSCFHFASSAEQVMREASEVDKKKFTEIALKYFKMLTNNYAHNIYNLIYQTIQDKLEKPDQFLDEWFTLLIKCLENEKVFYDKELKAGNISKVYWYPALYHSSILELLHEKLGKDKFMQAAKIFFSFPKELELHESDKLIFIITDLSKTDNDAKKIVRYLRDKNPSKYLELKK